MAVSPPPCGAGKEAMQLHHKSTEFNGRRIALEMLLLAAHALLLGVAVAVVLAVPVILVAMLAP
jgi:hypothetical protein